MKLHTTITSERGKPVTKSGNEYIEIIVQGENHTNILELKLVANESNYTITGYAIDEDSTTQRRRERYISYTINKR